MTLQVIIRVGKNALTTDDRQPLEFGTLYPVGQGDGTYQVTQVNGTWFAILYDWHGQELSCIDVSKGGRYQLRRNGSERLDKRTAIVGDLYPLMRQALRAFMHQ